MISWAISDRSLPARLTGGINTSLERHFWHWASLLLVLLLTVSIAKDLRSKLWIDELFTFYDAKQASPSEIVKAIEEGADAAPPLYAILVHWLLPVVSHEALAVRLPSTLGYCGMVFSLLAFCRRRMPAGCAFVGALLAAAVTLYYATEGRAYGLVLGCAAAALLCWQAAAHGRRRALTIPLLALCLAAMVSLHYFAIFFLGPLLLGELVRARESGKLDYRVLLAMVPVPLVLGLHYPLIAAARQFEANYWSKAHLGAIEAFYRSYFFDPYLYLWPLALIVLAFFPELPVQQRARDAGMPSHEWAVIGSIALIPPIVVVISKYTTHVFVDRYILWTVIGFGLLAAAVISKAVRGNVAVGVILTGVLLAMMVRAEVETMRGDPALRFGEVIRRELEKLPDGPELIVIPNARVFVEMAYYLEPRIRERIVYPVNRELDMRYRGYDTDSRLMVPLSRRVDIHVKDGAVILAENPRFLLAANPTDYLTSHLKSEGYRVVPVASGAAEPVLFEVTSRAFVQQEQERIQAIRKSSE